MNETKPTDSSTPLLNFSRKILNPRYSHSRTNQISRCSISEEGDNIDDIGLPILILVAIGIDLMRVQYAKEQAEMEKVLTEEQ